MKIPIIIALILIFDTFSSAQNYIQENFDTSISVGWTITDAGQSTGDSWASGMIGTNSLNGTNSAFVDSDANGSSNHMIETLTSPSFDASTAVSLFLDLEQYYRFSFSDSAIVEVYDGNNWIAVLTQTGTSVGAFSNPDYQHIDITTYKNANMRVRFRYNDNNNWARYWLIDNVHIYNSVCTPPANLFATVIDPATVNLGWTEQGTSTSWIIEWDSAGFLPGNGNDSITTGNPITIGGLNASTEYEFYVLSLCPGGDSSTATGPFSFFMPCPALSLPYLDDVENHNVTFNFDTSNCWTNDPTFSYDWNVDGGGSTPSNGTGPANAYSGNKYFYIEATSGSAGDQASLISPYADISTVSNPVFEFYYHMYGVAMGDLYTDIYDGSNWITADSIMGQQQTSHNDPWLKRQVNLSAWNGMVKIRLRARSNGNFQGDISVDDLAFDSVLCYEPISAGVINVTDSSATATWTETGNATSWEIEWGTNGFTPGTGTDTLTGSNPFVIYGLNADTDYDYYIHSRCNAGDSSAWVGPISFKTFCTANQLPWTEDVENHNQNLSFQESECWTTLNISSTSIPYCWNVDDGGSTPTAGTGPLAARNGSNYFYVEASDGQINDQAMLISPLIDISTTNDPALEFHYHMHGIHTGKLYTEVYDGSNWVVIDSITGEQQKYQADDWKKEQLSLNMFSGTIQFRFRAVSAGITMGDISLDDILLTEISCFEPTDLSTLHLYTDEAIITWNQNNTANNWQIEYGPSGFTMGTGTDTMTGSNIHTISGLQTDSFYDVYLRSFCGAGDSSVWIGPLTFRTRCDAVLAPWTDSIELHVTNTNIDYSQCWTSSGEGPYRWNIEDNGSTPTNNTGPLSAKSGIKYFYTEATGSLNGSETLLNLPLVNIDSLNQATLQFYYHMYGNEMGDLYTEIYKNGIWQKADSIKGEQHSTASETWKKRVVYLSGYNGELMIRFKAVSGGSAQGDISLDDISIEQAPVTDAVVSFYNPDSSFCNTTDISGSFIISNTTLSDADSIIYTIISDSTLLLSDTIIYLAGMTADTFSIPSFTASTGSTVLNIYIQLPGDPDLSNDSIKLTVYISNTNASITITDSLFCSSDTSGSLLAISSGGIAPYTYLWQGISFQGTTADISGLTSGNYQIIVTDSTGCSDTATTSLNANITIVISDSTSAILCAGDSNGTIIISPSDGTLPYSYLWNTSDTTDVLNNLIAGIYTVTVTDSNNCYLTSTISLADPAVLTLTISDNGDGTATATGSGGSGNYSYLWDSGTGGQTTATATGLQSNTIYSVTLSDMNSCTDTSDIMIIISKIIIQNNKQQINIYPNPAEQVLYIETSFEIETELTLSIFNASGKILMYRNIEKCRNRKTKINTENFSAGIYYIRFEHSQKTDVMKFIKTKY
jgi:hypothetical protein